YVANERQVWRLVDVDIKHQLDELVRKSEFDEAISLLQQVDSFAPDEKQAHLLSMKVAKAVWLFTAVKRYEDAMQVLLDMNADPADVIATFFPNLVTDAIKRIVGSGGGITTTDSCASMKQQLKQLVSSASSASSLSSSSSAAAAPIAMFTTPLSAGS